MITKEQAIDQACNYTANRLGIFALNAIANLDANTSSWDVHITGEQEEDLLKVIVKLTVKVYEDGNGGLKCRLAMQPIKAEDVEGELIVKDINWSLSSDDEKSEETTEIEPVEEPVIIEKSDERELSNRAGFGDLPA